MRLMFETYATGRYSDQGIADLLDARGYRTRKGNHYWREDGDTALTPNEQAQFADFQASASIKPIARPRFPCYISARYE